MYAGLGKMPWDMVVFLTITTAGFGVSVKRLAYPDALSSEPAKEISQRVNSSAMVGRNSTLDLGCLESLSRKDNRTMDERSVRVKGKICYQSRSKRGQFEDIEVKNLTTGVESTVFYRDADTSFLTDALILQSGKNVIQIRWRAGLDEPERLVVTELFGR